MRFLPLLLCVLALPLPAAEVEIVRIWPRHREATEFIGIGEYFGRAEDTGDRTILRSKPAERSGYYWLVRVRSSEPIPDATVEIALIRPGRTKPEVHRFSTALPGDSHPLLLGLTGSDWPDPDARPLAWRVRIVGRGGEQLAAERSFLWEH